MRMKYMQTIIVLILFYLLSYVFFVGLHERILFAQIAKFILITILVILILLVLQIMFGRLLRIILPDFLFHPINTKFIYSKVGSSIRDYSDSVTLTFIYVFILILISSSIIYFTNNLIGLNIQQSLFTLLLYYVFEVSTLFFSLSFREYPTLAEPRSWPTLSILLSTPFAFSYLSIRYRHIDFYNVGGVYITWVLTRYNIVNPIWIRPKEQTENYDSGLKGMLLKLDKKPTPHPTTSLS